jgi:hypothetical protein
METLRSFAILGIVTILLWLILRPRSAFVVRIEEGVPRTVKGGVPQAFLDDLATVCRVEGLVRGRVTGALRGHSIVLAFSRRIPPPVQQQLRNAWQLRY